MSRRPPACRVGAMTTRPRGQDAAFGLDALLLGLLALFLILVLLALPALPPPAR